MNFHRSRGDSKYLNTLDGDKNLKHHGLIRAFSRTNTDLTADQKDTIEAVLPKDQLKGFKGAYLETTQKLREQQGKTGGEQEQALDQIDFELVLFASALIDYDYIMGLIARFSRRSRVSTK